MAIIILPAIFILKIILWRCYAAGKARIIFGFKSRPYDLRGGWFVEGLPQAFIFVVIKTFIIMKRCTVKTFSAHRRSLTPIAW